MQHEMYEHKNTHGNTEDSSFSSTFHKSKGDDHFLQHLKRNRAGIIGDCLNKLEMAETKDESPPVSQHKNCQQSQGASFVNMGMGVSNMSPNKVYEKPRCPFCGESNLHVMGSRRRHVERHMEEVAFAVVSKPYEEWDFYSDSTSKS